MTTHLRRPAVLLAAATVGALVVISLRGGAAAPAAPSPPALATATVLRTDLQTSVLTGGTLGYRAADPVINELSGTYTHLPPDGAVIRRGVELYRVDNLPVVLMLGPIPAWRTFSLGMPDGPDVRELQANLIALGDAGGLLARPTGDYDWPTALAVERWQRSTGQLVTGEIPRGDVVFQPGEIRAGGDTQAPGQAASPGQTPLQATTTTRAVTVAANPNLPPTEIGERVAIVLPSGASTPGTITSIGETAPGGTQSAGQITVAPDRPAATGSATGVPVQVALTTRTARGVLAAPVSALLALAEGGYAVELVEPSGAHRLVAVHTGMFSGSRVQISGAAVHTGTVVVVAQ